MMGGDYDFSDTDPSLPTPADVRHARKLLILFGLAALIAGGGIVALLN